MQRVFVLDQTGQPLMPCHPARARQMLRGGKAAVFKRYPFTNILKDRAGGNVQPIEVKIDPGSQTTGIALVADFKNGKQVVWAAQLEHRGLAITQSLQDRRSQRRNRRSRRPVIVRLGSKTGRGARAGCRPAWRAVLPTR